MITIDILCHVVPGLRADEVEQWIGNAWLRAEGPPGRSHSTAEPASTTLTSPTAVQRMIRSMRP